MWSAARITVGIILLEHCLQRFLSMRLSDGIRVLGFADIIIVEAEDEDTLERRLEENTTKAKKLQIAVLKREAVLVTKRRVFMRPSFMIEGENITWKKSLTYLGVKVDKSLSFGIHVEKLH